MQTHEQYQQMRHNVIHTARNSMAASPFSNAYLFAWHAGVYPLNNSIEECDQPFAELFRVNAQQMQELDHFLQSRFARQDAITFWELEEIFETHLLEEWDRQKLLDACRYLCLIEALPKRFWQGLIRMATPESELHAICKDFDQDEILLM